MRRSASTVRETFKNNPITAKLRREDGASLVAALLLFVICAVVGSVILSAASSAMGRLSESDNGDDGSRERYVLTSFIKLLDASSGEVPVNDAEPFTSSYECFVDSSWTYYEVGQTSDGRLFPAVDEEGEYVSGTASEFETWPALSEDLTEDIDKASDLQGIFTGMAMQFISENWNSGDTEDTSGGYVTAGWIRDSVPDDSDWILGSFDRSIKSKTIDLKFTLDGTSEDYADSVWCEITMDPNLDIHMTVYRAQSDDMESDKAAASLIYYVEIPLSEDALIKYEQDTDVARYKLVTYLTGETDETTGEALTATTLLSDSEYEEFDKTTIVKQEVWRYYNVNRSLQFTNFVWDTAEVTTIEPDIQQ